MTLTIDVDLPADLEKCRLPFAVQQRLDRLLDQQDSGRELSEDERREAEGLVDLAEFLTLLRMRAERLEKGRMFQLCSRRQSSSRRAEDASTAGFPRRGRRLGFTSTMFCPSSTEGIPLLRISASRVFHAPCEREQRHTRSIRNPEAASRFLTQGGMTGANISAGAKSIVSASPPPAERQSPFSA